MQNTIPFKEFSKDQLATRDTMRANSKLHNEEIRIIPLSQIVTRESSKGDRFNVREVENYGDLNELAKSIRKNGQIQPGRVMALSSGSFAMIVGHRRLEALRIIEDEDRKECFFKAVVNPNKTTEVEMLLQSFLTQQEKALEQHEVAELFTRLLNSGMTQVQIAEATGKTPAYISQMISFAKEPDEIKEMVKFGRLTVNNSLKLKSQIPNVPDRIAAVKTAAEKKWDANEKRREDYADNIVYDENMVGHVKNDAPKDDPENIVKKTDNTKKGKRLKLEEVIASNTVLIPTMKNVRSRIEGLAAPEDTPDYNRGYATAITTILTFFNSEKVDHMEN